MARLFAIVRRQMRLLGLALLTTWVLAMASIIYRFRGGDPKRIDVDWKHKWGDYAPGIVGLDISVVHGTPGRTSPRGRIVVSNHRTPLDVVALMHLFGGYFLANHRVARAPIVGRAATRIGTVYVDREDRRSGVAAIRTMRRLLEEGKTVVVFPEGTTYGGDEVREFKGGAFTAASGLEVDVVPVGIAYTPGHELMGGRTGDHVRSFLDRKRTPAWVAIGEPLPFPKGRKGAEDAIRARVQEMVHRARRGADAALGTTTPVLTSTAQTDTETPS